MGLTSNLSVFLIGALLLPSVYPKTIPTINSERKIDPELQQTIDDLINNVFLPITGLTGLGLTVVKDDGDLLYTTGYGLSNIEKGYENGNKTQYGMGSLTKGFTSIMVIRLLHEKFPELGESALDVPINTLIPEANLTLIDRVRSEHTTFRDLLAHLVCIKETAIMPEAFSTREEMLFRIRYSPPEREPRTDQCYSQVGYAMAGEVAAVLGGKPYEALVQDLLDDLGMPNTTFVKRTDNVTEMPYRALPYYIKDDESHLANPELLKRIIPINAAGGMVSTPDDMVRYLRFLANGGSIDGKQIVPEEVLKWIKRNSYGMPTLLFKETAEDVVPYNNYGYGLGMQLSVYQGWEEIEHGGNLPPYSGQMAVFPAQKLGVYAAGHQFPPKLPLLVIPLIIFELLNGNQNVTVAAQNLIEKMKRDEEAKAKMADHDWQTFYAGLVKQSRSLGRGDDSIQVGKYGSGHAGDLELSERFNQETNQTQYFIEYGKWYHGWLEPVPDVEGVFRIKFVTDAIHDDYIIGLEEGLNFAIIPGDDTVTILNVLGVVGVFKLGESLETLPVIPWDPRSC